MAKERAVVRCTTEGLSRSEVIVLLFQTFRSLKWGVEHLHPMRIVAITPRSWASHGEQVIVDIDGTGFDVTSKFEQWSPLAKRSRLQGNLDRFMVAFGDARANTSPELMASELKELEESGVMDLDASTVNANEFKWKDIALFFLPRQGFMATPILIDISLIVYVLMVVTGVHFMEPTVDDLLKWGGNLRYYTLGGEPWRLLTCCFVHIGIVHLLFNMYALFTIGIQLEPLLGSARIFALYVITALVASMSSLWWHANTVSAGASGAIFGLYGVFLALLFTDLIPKETRKQLLQSIGIFVLYNLIYGLKGGVDNAAHIGGLVSGMVLGFVLYPALNKPENRSLQWTSLVAPSLLMLGAGTVMLKGLPAEDRSFHNTIDRFQVIEERGLAPFRMPEGSTGTEQLVLVQDSGLPAWKEAVQLLEGTMDLKLSDELVEKRRLFLQYATLRLENMELLDQVLKQDTGTTELELQASFARIDSVLGILNAE